MEKVDPIILAVDTSSPRASYAASRGERLLAMLYAETVVPHSQTFFTNLSALLNLAGLTIDQIDIFAVSTGPGSFTGLRVGLAAVKGLAAALERPAIGINSIDLEALATGVAGSILVMLEAGREEVYLGLRRIDAQGRIEVVGIDRVGPASELLGEIMEDFDSLVITGSGASKFHREIKELAQSRGIELLITRVLRPTLKVWQLIDSQAPLGGVLARYAASLKHDLVRPGIHAYYIRPSDAEIK